MEDTNNQPITVAPIEIPQLTSASASYLLKAAKWGKFLALLGFILTSLMIIAGIMMSFVLNKVKDYDLAPLNSPFSPKVISIFYISVAALSLIPVSFLHAFSNNAIKAVQNGSTKDMTTALKNMKNLFVFLGISIVTGLIIYTLTLLLVGAVAIFI